MDYYEYAGRLLDEGMGNYEIVPHLLAKHEAGEIQIPDQIFIGLERAYLISQTAPEDQRIMLRQAANQADLKPRLFGQRERLARVQRDMFRGMIKPAENLSQFTQLDLLALRKPELSSLVVTGIIDTDGQWRESRFQKYLTLLERIHEHPRFPFSPALETLCLLMNGQMTTDGELVFDRIDFRHLLLMKYRQPEPLALAVKLANSLVYPKDQSTKIDQTITLEEYQRLVKVGAWFLDGKWPVPRSVLWPLEQIMEAVKGHRKVPSILGAEHSGLDFERLRNLSAIIQDVLMDEEPSVERLKQVADDFL